MSDMGEIPTGRWPDDEPRLNGHDKAEEPKSSYDKIESLDFQQYIDSFEVPDWLIDCLIVTGRVYSLTAVTGHGKTAWATNLALSVACGVSFSGLEVRKGRVLYLSGENDEDQKSRVLATSQAFNLYPEPGMFRVIAGGGPIGTMLEDLRDIIEEHGPFALIVVDTSAAYYGGEDDNSNTDQHAHASYLRTISQMTGSPTVLTLCHPIKNASRENLVPRGGSSFMNAVDGNLTLWKSNDRATLHHYGKFRGSSFAPLEFLFEDVLLNNHKDSKGNPIKSVVLRALSEQEVQAVMQQEWRDEDRVLYEMLHNPEGSQRDWAKDCRFLDKNEAPVVSKLHRLILSLATFRLVEKDARDKRWVLSEKGRKEASKIT